MGLVTMLLVARSKRSWGEGRLTPRSKLWEPVRGSPGTFYGGGFATLLASTTPLFWVFFLLAGAAQIVLRFREPEAPARFERGLTP